MKILALDQSLNTTGWAIFDEDSLVDFNHFKISAAGSISERLGALWEQIHKLHQTHQFEYLYLEDIQYQNNKDTYKKLAYAQAAILLWCFFSEVDYLILSPSHWRKIITDNYGVKFGRARTEQKAQCGSFVKEKFRVDPTEDESDAIAIGVAGNIERTTIPTAFKQEQIMELPTQEELAEAAVKVCEAAYKTGVTTEELLPLLETMQEILRKDDFNRNIAHYSRYNSRYTRRNKCNF